MLEDLALVGVAALLLTVMAWWAWHDIKLRRMEMSKINELTAAVDAVLAALTALQGAGANSTPDDEVQAQVDRLNAALTPAPVG